MKRNFLKSIIGVFSCSISFCAVGIAQNSTDLSGAIFDKYGKESVLVLGRSNRVATVDGMTVHLIDSGIDSVPVRILCLSDQHTPALAIDPQITGRGAQLANLTVGGNQQCRSYRITIENAQFAADAGQPGGERSAEGRIAVGIHHNGITPRDALNAPAVFVFNPVHGNWTEAAPFQPKSPEGNQVYATLTERTQQVISGAISLPESLGAEPTRSSPASLGRSLEQVSPLAGFLSINNVEPDSKGGYDVKLPLLLRPSRGPGPSFAIRYNSSGAPGVLGRGWDLTISSIEIRGPSPVYHPAYETEDYLLDGIDLIALDAEGKDIPQLHKGGPIIPRVSGIRVFRQRNNSAGLIIRRYGNDPGNYFWEVWDPSSHVTRLYGGAFDGNGKPPVRDGNNGVLTGDVTFGDGQQRRVIGQWGLTAEFDRQPARSGAVYRYTHAFEPGAEQCQMNWGGPCTPALRLHEVIYNRSFTDPAADNDAGVTFVRFGWSKRDQNRYNSDGRLGLFRAFEYWLDEISVQYKPHPNNLWLASTGAQPPGSSLAAGMVLFSRHRFNAQKPGLTDEEIDRLREREKCLNFDRTLHRYEVEANTRYDSGRPADEKSEGQIELNSQVFEFKYAGEGDCPKGSKGEMAWPAPSELSEFGQLPQNAPAGQLGFSTKLLDDLGFGLLSRRSALGTGRSEETGGSLYVGVGPPGNPYNKESTTGYKSGVNFTKSEGNSTLVDVTGDGIDDIVYRNDGKLIYCSGVRNKNSSNGIYEISYPENRCGEIIGVNDFFVSSSDTISFSIEKYPGYNSLFGVGFNRSQNETYVYFTDADGDGLVDVVNYGRILYNQGETVEEGRKVVRFVPRSGLRPPVPGASADVERTLGARLPKDMRDFIRSIEAKLEGTSRTIMALQYSQKVIAWEAPLSGQVSLSGEFTRGRSAAEPGNEGPLKHFGPAEFEALPAKLAPYRNYIRERHECAKWAADETCHVDSSDPLGPRFAGVKRNIDFARTYPGRLKIWLSRRQTGQVLECGSAALSSVLRLQEIDLAACTGPGGHAGSVRVLAGDVIYIGYTVHPHFSAWVQPEAKVAYKAVDDDEAFRLSEARDPRVAALPCLWKEQSQASTPPVPCLLRQLPRYEFELGAAFLTSSPGAIIVLPPGRNRVIGGRVEIPADIARDYQLYFDVQGEVVEAPVGPQLPGNQSSQALPPSATLRTIFRQDLSSACAAATDVCLVDIAPACVGAAQAQTCADFLAKEAPVMLKSRIWAVHRIAGHELEVRNLSSRLASVRWHIPPIVTSDIIRPQGTSGSSDRILFESPATAEPSIVALPIVMGEPDLEYVRVENGRFLNPDTTLDDGDPRPREMFFDEIVKAERKDVEFAKLRQTLALCSFSREIHEFFLKRSSEEGSPPVQFYGDPWASRIKPYMEPGGRCLKAEERFARYTFTTRKPEITAPDSLRLPELLKHLPLSEQLTSAETLLERVLASLALGEELLIDAPRLTRRGYRLPAKPNPFDCNVLSSTEPLTAPVAVENRNCAFRLSANFAMQQFEEALRNPADPGAANRMRAMLRAFENSKESAFKIELRVNVNGVPVRFRELTGDETGNAPCDAAARTTCIGSYGTRDPITEHFHPARWYGNPGTPTGDVLQRITLNKRVSRAVAFSNSIMLNGASPYCTTPFYPIYQKWSDMEKKQDCSVDGGLKYKSQQSYVIDYTISEDNQFNGRNRVFEFDASPLDVAEFFIRLSPVEKTVVLDPQNATKLIGNYSILDGGAIPNLRIEPKVFVIPRSPSDILSVSDAPSDSDVQSLTCPEMPTAPGSFRPVPTSCRPWTRLGWTEILFGAQYRTYSDAQFDPKVGQPDAERFHFSLLRRRDMLRLHPEIEVEANRYSIVGPERAVSPGVNFLSLAEVAAKADSSRGGSRFAYMTQDPRVAKIGGDWSLFAGRIAPDALRKDPAFLVKPPVFFQPRLDSLRFGIWPGDRPESQNLKYDDANATCSPATPGGSSDIDKCEGYMSSTNVETIIAPNLMWMPLIHVFRAPVLRSLFDQGSRSNVERPATSVCGAERPTRIASCWKGYDDTVFFERGVSQAPEYRSPVYSVGALVGFERPAIAEFLFGFNAYRKMTCIDLQRPTNDPELADLCRTEGEGAQVSGLPNRPTPPDEKSVIEVFAPIQTSRSRSVSFNGGGSSMGMSFNTHRVETDLKTTSQFIDVNGDGFPDVITNGNVELSSPVGLPRREWWTHFRARNELAPFGAGETTTGMQQGARSTSAGAGFGLSADTAILPLSRATRSKGTGSSDARVEPGFDLSMESGQDDQFVDLRDFNGDGLLDVVGGNKFVSGGLKLSFNSGNALRSNWSLPISVDGHTAEAFKFRTNHGAGFGVRLGFSSGAGSFVAGMGLAHRDNGSQAALLDFTGDGRPDIVLPLGEGFLVYPNLGNGFGPGRFHRLSNWKQQHRQGGLESGTELSETTLIDAGAAYTYGFSTKFFKVVFNPHVKWAQGQTRELLSIRDINGDGVPDVVTVKGHFLPGPFSAPSLAPSSLKTNVHYNPSGKYHLLTEITNPSGSRLSMSHSLIGNSGPEHGRPVWALTGVTRFDGHGGNSESKGLPSRGHDFDLTTYEYEGGYHNRAERQFYGFSSRTARHYGCQSSVAGARCKFASNASDGLANLDEQTLFDAGFRKLQVVHQSFSNRDFLTQGLELERTVAGARSAPNAATSPAVETKAVSRERFRYSIDHLNSLAGDLSGKCDIADRSRLSVSWRAGAFNPAMFDRSTLGSVWDGSSPFVPKANGTIVGQGGICTGLDETCLDTLRRATCDAGYEREQRAFWAQQSGSVRQRLVLLESFDARVALAEPKLPVDSVDPNAPKIPRLRSAIAFDHDQWGQIVGLNNVGEAADDWTPQASSSTYAKITYAQRQALNVLPLPAGQQVGYPMLGLTQDVQVFGGPWQAEGPTAPPLRVREALYSVNSGKPEDGSLKAAQLSDICTYPGGDGFVFQTGMCQAFKQNMLDALNDGYSTVQDALRKAYAKTNGLPKGVSSFDAVVHHQLVSYDKFGNLTHAVSPISRSNEWLERRFAHDDDPFRRTATTVSLTRCVNDVPGAGANSTDIAKLPDEQRPKCTLGLGVLPDPVQRKAVTHRSTNRIDHHFGAVAETRDINQNRMLYDFDRWGRLSLIARSWGNAPRENRTLVARLQRAVAKDPAVSVRPEDVPIANAEKWRLLAAIDYQSMEAGLLRSNIRRFESSDAYSGLLGHGQTTRETAMFADGHGRLILNLRETDICLGVDSAFVVDGKNKLPDADLTKRCTDTATIAATPGVKADSLGRTLETFEPYAWAGSKYRENSLRRLINQAPPGGTTTPVSSTTYDGAGRPLLVQSRLSDADQTSIKGAAQYQYRIIPQNGDRLARFQALSLSPRCTASAVWSDARGLRRTVFEDQQRFHAAVLAPPSGGAPIGQTYTRDLDKTRGFCLNIDSMAEQWSSEAEGSETATGSQPARVSYTYDPLQQLTSVDSPLDGSNRARTAVRFDLLGRTREMQEPNSGCTRYEYDGLNSLISETGFRHEGNPDTPCGTSSKVRNQKTYGYAAGRLIRMAYHSLEEQGGPPDERDAVRIFHDRSPSAIIFGTPSEALRFVPNDQANRRFIDTAGRACDNCVGQATVVADRTGARAFAFNELGLAKREVRSIVAPLRDVQNSQGQSETYLPEVAFYELEAAYTAFGDPVQERFSEAPPMNPAKACIAEGVNACLARFTLGRRYAPDGAIAQLLFNGKPVIHAAQDGLARPAIRWTANGIATGYSYDPLDLRLNRMTTLTAVGAPDRSRPVQSVGYQYDGGGNILEFSNQALVPGGAGQPTPDAYESAFAFRYDPVNRLIGFNAAAVRGQGTPDDVMRSQGAYVYDMGHRFQQRSLTIASGAPGTAFTRRWQYQYGGDPTQSPLHAPIAIGFGASRSDNPQIRQTAFDYDDIGRMTRMKTPDHAAGADAPPSLLSNRAMTWDAEGRLIRVRGVKDGLIPGNERAMREDYLYDSGGNRALKINRPIGQKPGETVEREHEVATLYLTPFYSRPYDRRGTVQIAQGSLPAVSLTAPADPSEDPIATFLYADLPVGSMTAAVTVTGEATDPGAVRIARREYSPYGLELTNDSLAVTGREGAGPLSVFHGKELDRVTNFASFGARYFSRDAGIWLKPDPAISKYLGSGGNDRIYQIVSLGLFGFANNNPVSIYDPDGREGYPSYGAVLSAPPDTWANRHPIIAKMIGDSIAPLNWKYWGTGVTVNPISGIVLTPKEAMNEKVMLIASVGLSAASRSMSVVARNLTKNIGKTDELISGFRAVSTGEIDDIAKNGLRPHPDGKSMIDKWFWETREHAQEFMKKYPDLDQILEVKIPKSVYEKSHRAINQDTIGPAICVSCNDFKFIIVP